MASCMRISRVVFAAALACVIVFILITQMTVSRRGITPRGFLVDTPACRILDLDPFDSSIAHLVQRHGKIECTGAPSITYEDGDVLRINKTVVKKFYKGNIQHCIYQPIFRGPNQSDFEFKYGDYKQTFNQDIKLKDEVVKVVCYDNSNRYVYSNFHSLIIPNTTLDKDRDDRLRLHESKHKPKEVLNVLMIGVDSVSRLNSIRQMPLMRKYLLEDLEAIELLGYTKLELNTFVNVVPMTTGMFVFELPYYGPVENITFDRYNFIWKNFSQSGYRTLYAEDAPGMGIFTYLKRGFNKPPTDHYNRVFSDAIERDGEWNQRHNCLEDRLETDLVLKYVEDFLHLYRDKPHFAFSFVTRITHGDFNRIGGADDPHFRFLQRIHKAKLLKNTLMIYFSDHGMRFGDVRNTLIGRLEDRLPFVFFVFPKWFKEKYPEIIKTLKINSNRLTTPFDIYETLKDILYFTGDVKTANVSNRGISLFSEIPRERSCAHATIGLHWCVCLERKDISISAAPVKKAAKNIVDQINKMLTKFRHLCAVLKLKEIKSAVGLEANRKIKKAERNWYDVIPWLYGQANSNFPDVFQLTIVTTPGEAMFEITVSFDQVTKDYVVAGDISRINKYGNQSICINDFNLRNYCLCK